MNKAITADGLSRLALNLEEARIELEKARSALQHAQSLQTRAINNMNAAQKDFDAGIKSLKETMTVDGTDWSTAKTVRFGVNDKE